MSQYPCGFQGIRPCRPLLSPMGLPASPVSRAARGRTTANPDCGLRPHKEDSTAKSAGLERPAKGIFKPRADRIGAGRGRPGQTRPYMLPRYRGCRPSAASRHSSGLEPPPFALFTSWETPSTKEGCRPLSPQGTGIFGLFKLAIKGGRTINKYAINPGSKTTKRGCQMGCHGL